MSNYFFEVLRPGINTTFQDKGRFHMQHLGVTPGGCMDLDSFLIGNALVGNNSNARSYALKAANLRKNWGDPYILIGKLYAKTASQCGTDPASKKAGYWAAIEKLQLAKRIDKSCEKEANSQISQCNKRVPTKSVWRDNVTNPDAKSYKINCWYTETVKVKF